MAELFFFVVCVGVVPVLINKSTEGERFNWLKPRLREAWTLLSLFFGWYFLKKPEMMAQMSKWHSSLPGLPGYLVVAVVGAAALSAYWWFAGLVLHPAKQEPPASLVKPTIEWKDPASIMANTPLS